jgi:hypothetical protein
MDNNAIAKNIISIHKERKLPLWLIEEIGANVEVAHTLYQEGGASSVIAQTQSNYHQKLQLRNEANIRSVSKEFIQQ